MLGPWDHGEQGFVDRDDTEVVRGNRAEDGVDRWAGGRHGTPLHRCAAIAGARRRRLSFAGGVWWLRATTVRGAVASGQASSALPAASAPSSTTGSPWGSGAPTILTS